MTGKYSADGIEVLPGLEAIRRRPGMYIGSIDTKGLDRMLDEIIDNSTEEAIAGHCDRIEVILNPDNSVTVTDNGRGIPVDIHPKTQKSALETILTTLCACGRFKSDNEYKIYGGLRGIGLAPINALSEWLEVTVWGNNKTYYQRYEKGNALTTLQEQPNDKNGTGTSISFKPDSDIFGKSCFNLTALKMRLQESAYLNANLKLILRDFTSAEEKINFYHYPQGMRDYLSQINKNRPLINDEVIYFKEKQDDILVEVALQWCSDDNEEYCLNTFPGIVFYKEWHSRSFKEHQQKLYDAIHILSFANQVYTFDGGTHVEGVKRGIIQAMNAIGDRSNLARPINLTWENISLGLTGIVSVMLLEPEYNGSMKWELANPEVTEIVSILVTSTLTQYLEQHLQVAQKLILLLNN